MPQPDPDLNFDFQGLQHGDFHQSQRALELARSICATALAGEPDPAVGWLALTLVSTINDRSMRRVVQEQKRQDIQERYDRMHRIVSHVLEAMGEKI